MLHCSKIHLSGAIATLRAEGTGAVDAVAAGLRLHSGKSLHSSPVDRPMLGLFGPEPAEPIVVHRRRDGAIDIHCHGGTVAAERIGRILTDAGGQIIGWRDWLREQSVDPVAADACLAMTHARTERTAAVLLDQYGGAFDRALAEVERLVAAGETRTARQHVEAMLAKADVGRHLTCPWRVVLAGQPNVGKSSLLNALLGYERAIVHTTAGTTRDVLSATTAIDGWPVELIDTAGLLPAEEGQEDGVLLNRGIALGKEQMAAADLLVLVCDGSQPLSAEDRKWLECWPDALRVDNKSDLPPATDKRPPAVQASALLGQGLAELLQAIATRLVPVAMPPGAAVPFTDQQCSRLQNLLDTLA